MKKLVYYNVQSFGCPSIEDEIVSMNYERLIDAMAQTEIKFKKWLGSFTNKLQRKVVVVSELDHTKVFHPHYSYKCVITDSFGCFDVCGYTITEKVLFLH